MADPIDDPTRLVMQDGYSLPSDDWKRLGLAKDQIIKWAKVFNEAADTIELVVDLRQTLERSGVIDPVAPQPRPSRNLAPKDDPTQLAPKRLYPATDANDQPMCMNCGLPDPKPAWRRWMRDESFRVCHPCHSRINLDLRRINLDLLRVLEKKEKSSITRTTKKDDEDIPPLKTPTPPPRPKPTKKSKKASSPPKKAASSSAKKVSAKKNPKPPPRRSTRSTALHPTPPNPFHVDPNDDDEDDDLRDDLRVTHRDPDRDLDEDGRVGRRRGLFVPASEEEDDPAVIGGGGGTYWVEQETGKGKQKGKEGKGKEKARVEEVEEDDNDDNDNDDNEEGDNDDNEEDDNEEDEVLANVTPKGKEVYGTPDDDDDEEALSSPSKKGSTLAKKVGGALSSSPSQP
ncbi:hypothetical protein A4X13_0g7088 [Tilletia indica]|uniref:Uncharacterized protein n=1 Tax=Tilletia indica TaxID=43049 RepID=A0A8T8SLG2_9BASI|nr:hypothetical protein A4X13_0g7088 [Tilletia indica]